MRKTRVAGLCLFVVASHAAAQQQQPSLNPAGQGGPPVVGRPVVQQGAAPAAPLNPADRLDALLIQWEQKMKSISSLEADVTRLEVDATSKTQKFMQGKAKFLRPDRGSLVLQRSDNPQIYENFVYTGTYLHQYNPQTKKLLIHELPPRVPGREFADNNFFGFLIGMKASEAKDRYGLRLVKEDDNYLYVMIEAKTSADLTEFTAARMVLWKNTMLPRQLEFEAPNKDVTRWDLPRIDVAAKLTANDFVPPSVPRDWITQKVPRQSPGVNPVSPPGNPAPPAPSKVRPSNQ